MTIFIIPNDYGYSQALHEGWASITYFSQGDVISGWVAVSYTHLDVYKRQLPLWSPGGFSLRVPSTHQVPDIAANAQKLGLIQATDDIADHRGHDPGRAGHSDIRGLLHHETDLG